MTAYLYLIISALSLAGMSILRKEYDKRNPKGVVGGVVFVVVGALIERSSAIKNMLPNRGRGESPERVSRSENQQKDENTK